MLIVLFHVLPTYFAEHKNKPCIWLFLALCVPTLLSAEYNAANRPNVVFILADDLGYGDLSCYGATKVNTHHIDSLAEDGLRFTDAHSAASVCTPTRYNILTGRHCWRTWAKSSTVWANDPLLIETDRYTLADLFKDQGYTTAILGKWHLGFGTPDMQGWDGYLGPDYNQELKPGPLELGFDYYWGFPHVGQRPHFIIENHRVLNLSPGDPITIIPDTRLPFYTNYLKRPRTVSKNPRLDSKGGISALYKHEDLSNRLTDRTVRYLEEVEADNPFFLYVCHRNIHGPLIPDPKFNNTSEIGKRGDFINEYDASVGRILEALDEKGLRDSTLVLFSSDNGGVIRYEPIDYAQDQGHFINGPLRGQKGTAYEGGNRVPFLARWPGKIVAGTESSTVIALQDLIATFADLFEEKLPVDSAEDSFSFLPALLDLEPRQAHRKILLNDSSSGIIAIRKGPWKLIPSYHGGRARGPYDGSQPIGQLFHIENDLRESSNLYEEHPEIVAELTRLLNRVKNGNRTAPTERSLASWQ